jgi:tRNA(Arg) A34 adenosine deaminase TadA
MTESVISICCGAVSEIVSYHIQKVVPGNEITDTGYKCLNCGHVFHIWTSDKNNKLAPEIIKAHSADSVMK